MHPRLKIVERNVADLSQYQNLIVYGPPESDDLSYLSPRMVFTVDYRVFNSLSLMGETVRFGLDASGVENADAALVFIPKAKAELDLALQFVCSMLEIGGAIYLVGEKKAGIASAAKKLSSFGVDASKVDSAAHCQLWHVTLNEDVSEFNLDNWFQTFPVSVGEISLEVATIPGVFSFGELDDATKLLMENMFYKLRGRVLDFGCGSGVLGAFTKLLNPDISLEMVDLSYLALECTKKTLALNSIDAEVYASDGWSDIKGRVNAVVTNPPFHQGVATEYNTTEGFIRKSSEKMAKHAPLLLVANNFLRYSPIIEATLGRCDIHAENTKFRVYKAYR